MTTTTAAHPAPTGSPAAVLAAAVDERACADEAEARLLGHAAEWVDCHPPETLLPRTDADPTPGGDRCIYLAGEGTPAICDFAIDEFATALGMSSVGGAKLLGDALELRHRLPRLWKRVHAGRVQVWRARKIANATTSLPPAGADWVDRQLAPFAHALSFTQLEDTIAEATLRFDPQAAAERTRQIRSGRYVDIRHSHDDHTALGPAAGTSRIHAQIDTLGALALDECLDRAADRMATACIGHNRQERRAITLADMARDQLALDFIPIPDQDDDVPDEDLGTTPAEAGSKTDRMELSRLTRQTDLVVYLHLSDAAVTEFDSLDPVARVQSTRTLIPTEMVRQWCGRDDTRIIIKPVIDTRIEATNPVVSPGFETGPQGAFLNHRLPSRPPAARFQQSQPAEVEEALCAVSKPQPTTYTPSAKLAEQVRLKHPACVGPHCTRTSDACDLDHWQPWPHGPTTTSNLYPLCRRHHRLKTHGGWTYQPDNTGILWTTPHGRTYRVTATGTEPDPDG